MEKSSKQNLKLGLMVIVSTVFFVISIYFISQGQNIFSKSYTISAYFKHVNGLMEGNNVRYSGIDVGTVRSIKMHSDSVIGVDMKIDHDIVQFIRKNAVASIGSDGLVGNMIINISPGDKAVRFIRNGDTIRSLDKVGADDILNTLNASISNTKSLSEDLLKITNAMYKGEGLIGTLLNDTIITNDLRQSIKQLKATSYATRNTINDIDRIARSISNDRESVMGILLNDTVAGNRLKSTIIGLEKSSLRIESAVDNFDRILAEVNTGNSVFNYIFKDSTLVKQLESTMKNINEGTEKFNENMEALKHNFLTRGYFRKLERQENKERKDNEKLDSGGEP